MNSQPRRESCFRGRCFPQNNRCQLRKSPHLLLQPIPVSQPQGGLCLRDANSSCVPALLHSPHPASPLQVTPPLLCSTVIPSSTTFQAGLGDNLGLAFALAQGKAPYAREAFAPALLPTEGRSQEGASLWAPSSGCAARWCSGSQNLASCSLWPKGPHLTLGMEPLGRQQGPPQHFGCDGLPVLFPHSPH